MGSVIVYDSLFTSHYFLNLLLLSLVKNQRVIWNWIEKARVKNLKFWNITTVLRHFYAVRDNEYDILYLLIYRVCPDGVSPHNIRPSMGINQVRIQGGGKGQCPLRNQSYQTFQILNCRVKAEEQDVENVDVYLTILYFLPVDRS